MLYAFCFADYLQDTERSTGVSLGKTFRDATPEAPITPLFPASLLIF